MYFTFKGISSEEYGLVVNKMPTYIKPEHFSEIITVQGKDGASVVDYGYKPYTLKAIVTLMDVSKLDEIMSWLDGSGQLVVSDDPYKYRNVKVLNGIDYQRLSELKEASIEFFVYDPYRYINGEVARTVTSFPGSVRNDGTTTSKPIITIVGSGSVSITINGTTFGYTFPSGESVKLDCEEMDATYDGILRNQYMTGNFPTLKVGVNSITVSGTVTSIKFEKHSRYL